MTLKKKLIVSYENLDKKIKNLIEKKYPYGVEDYLKKVKLGDTEYHTLIFETEEISYLVKFTLKKDRVIEDLDSLIETEPEEEELPPPADDDF